MVLLIDPLVGVATNRDIFLSPPHRPPHAVDPLNPPLLLCTIDQFCIISLLDITLAALCHLLSVVEDGSR